MGSLKLTTASSGSVILSPENTASDVTVTIPATTATMVTTAATQTLTNKTLSSGLIMGASTITSGTAVASTSGTSIDFTSIPSWVKKITLMFSTVSNTGTGNMIVQIGTGSTPTTSGYFSIGGFCGSAANGSTSSTSGFIILTDNAADEFSGVMTLTLLNSSTNLWTCGYSMARKQNANNYAATGGGTVTLSGTLGMLRLTTSAGTATFDAGSINILYE